MTKIYLVKWTETDEWENIKKDCFKAFANKEDAVNFRKPHTWTERLYKLWEDKDDFENDMYCIVKEEEYNAKKDKVFKAEIEDREYSPYKLVELEVE